MTLLRFHTLGIKNNNKNANPKEIVSKKSKTERVSGIAGVVSKLPDLVRRPWVGQGLSKRGNLG